MKTFVKNAQGDEGDVRNRCALQSCVNIELQIMKYRPKQVLERTEKIKLPHRVSEYKPRSKDVRKKRLLPEQIQGKLDNTQTYIRHTHTQY